MRWKGVIGIAEVVNIGDYKLKSPYNRDRLLKIYNDSIKYGLIALSENDWFALVKRDIIKPDTVLSQITMLKEEAVLKVHRYKISPLADGRAGTYIPDDSKANHRRNIKASNYDVMINQLFDFYYPEGYADEETDKDKLRLCDIFDNWLDYKCKKNGNKEETKKQNRKSYKKYVERRKIAIMPLSEITTIDIEEWAIDILTEFRMTAKSFNTHKIVVMNALVYAKRKGYIKENPWIKEELDYKRLLSSPRRKPSSDMVFYPDEIESLFAEFERGYKANCNSACIGLMINFDLGLRIGELCALKWMDIDWKNETVFIHRMEDSSGNVVDYVKSDSQEGYRELVLSDSVIRILRRLKENSTILSEYIFCNEIGARKTKLQFLNKLRRAQRAVKFEKEKGSHCIRRTVASRMNASGIALEEIRRWLGHTDLETTLKYIYNPFRESETNEKIKNNSILTTNKNCLQLSSKFKVV